MLYPSFGVTLVIVLIAEAIVESRRRTAGPRPSCHNLRMTEMTKQSGCQNPNCTCSPCTCGPDCNCGQPANGLRQPELHLRELHLRTRVHLRPEKIRFLTFGNRPRSPRD